MKRIKLMGLALIAVFLLGALGASSAMAEEGGNPEILPLPTPTAPLTFTSETDGPPRLVTTAGTEIQCKEATNEGEFTSKRLGTLHIDFEKCVSAKAPCTSTNDNSGIILTEGKIHLVDILPTGTLDLGLWFEPLAIGGGDLKFKCGIITIEILGSLIGEVDNEHSELLKDLEKGKHFIVLWKEEKQGEQLIKTCMLTKEFCEGKTFELKATLGKGEELAVEIADALVLFLKAIEIHF